MPKCVNRVTLIGYLVERPDFKRNLRGKSVAAIRLITSYEWIDKKTGEKITAADLHNVILFNRDAELAEAYLKKGSKIYIEGKIKNHVTEIQGRQVKTCEVHVSEMQMLDPPPAKHLDVDGAL